LTLLPGAPTSMSGCLYRSFPGPGSTRGVYSLRRPGEGVVAASYRATRPPTRAPSTQDFARSEAERIARMRRLGHSRPANRRSATEHALPATRHRLRACSTKYWTIISSRGDATAVSAIRATSGLHGQVGMALILLYWISKLAIVPFSVSASA
jgi:hypothetical protein